MSDIAWDEDVRGWFDPEQNGTAPDVVIEPTSLADWDSLLDLLRSEHWRSEYRLDEQVLPVPASAADLFAGGGNESWGRLWLWPAPDLECVINLWGTPDAIVGDVSLYDIQGQQQLDVFCGFLRRLGSALGKRVLMYSEGTYQDGEQRYPPVLAYEPDEDRVRFLAGPW